MHEVDGDIAVDEIVVSVGDEWVPGPLAATLAASGAGTLLSSRRMTTIDDPMVGALEAVAAMVSGDQGAIDAACCTAVLSLAHGASARMLDVDVAALEPAGRVALGRGGTMPSPPDPQNANWRRIVGDLSDVPSPVRKGWVSGP